MPWALPFKERMVNVIVQVPVPLGGWAKYSFSDHV